MHPNYIYSATMFETQLKLSVDCTTKLWDLTYRRQTGPWKFKNVFEKGEFKLLTRIVYGHIYVIGARQTCRLLSIAESFIKDRNTAKGRKLTPSTKK